MTRKCPTYLVTLVLTLVLVTAQGKRWNTNKDSIIIEAEYDEPELAYDEPVDKPECRTPDYEAGQCVTVKRCHPILFSEQGQVRNLELAESYSDSIDSECSQNATDVPGGDVGEKIICCAIDKVVSALRTGLNDDLQLYPTTTPGTPFEEESVTGVNQVQTTERLSIVIEGELGPEELPLIDEPAGTVAPVIDEEVVVTTIVVPPKEIVTSAPVSTVDVTSVPPAPMAPEVEPVPISGVVEEVVNESPVAPAAPETPAVQEQDQVIVTEKPVEVVEIVTEAAPTEPAVVSSEKPFDTCPAEEKYNKWPIQQCYPWLASILTKSKTGPLCSGSLIDNRHVLTAAHCLHRFNPRDVARMQVRIGFSKYKGNDTLEHHYLERRATKIILHKYFNSQQKMDNNVALIQLNKPVVSDEHVSPVNIFNIGEESYDAGICYASQAGFLRFGNRKVTSITQGMINFIEAPMGDFFLKESLSRIFTNTECRQSLGQDQITDSMVCAKPEFFETDELTDNSRLFKGNDGGPLLIKDGNRVQQIGIKSWAYEGNQYPTVFTKVDCYLKWIKDNLNM